MSMMHLEETGQFSGKHYQWHVGMIVRTTLFAAVA
jgi:hypothetical protein